MKIKRFFATNMRQAIRQVRNEQGPDAVILSTRAVDGGIEIISAIDYDQNLVSEMVESVKKSDKPADDTDRERPDTTIPVIKAAPTSIQTMPVSRTEERSTTAEANPASNSDAHGSQEAGLTQLRHELNSMKEFLRDQMVRIAQDDFSRNQPVRAQHVKRLSELGLDPKLAREIADQVRELADPEKSWREVLLRFAKRIPISRDDMVRNGGIIALIGPTGVGKTTTLAKLAARFSLHHGRQHVVMISTDGYRIGAHKQLQTYGQILKVPVLIAAADRLKETLEGTSDKKLILIDTTGMSPRDARLKNQIGLLADHPLIKNHLILSANTQRPALDQIIRAYGARRLHGCILTKLDEAVSLGALLSEIIHHRLPLTYVCNGQRVPEDIHSARVNDLLTRTLSLARRMETTPEEARPPQSLRTREVKVNAHI